MSRAFLLAGLVGSGAIAAQPAVAQAPRVLTGRVVDLSRQPLSSAMVRVQNSAAQSVFTNADGQFRFSLSADDSITIAFLRVGYEPRTYRLDSLEALLRRREEIVLTEAPARFNVPSPPAHPPNILDDTIPDLARGAMARAAGLKPLYEHGPGSPREVRLTANFGLGAPDMMIVLRPGRIRINGELFVAYRHVAGSGDVIDTVALANAMRRSGCTQPRMVNETLTAIESNRAHATIVCRPRVRKTPKWGDLWRTLESLDVWTLPDDDELAWSGVVVTDGVCVAIETFKGKYRRVQHCQDVLAESPEAARAERVIRLIMAVAATIR